MFTAAIVGVQHGWRGPLLLQRHIEGANIFSMGRSLTALHRAASLACCLWQRGALLMNSRINNNCWVRRDQANISQGKPTAVIK